MMSHGAAPTIRLVITDLDNTLYDWVGWYARALETMTTQAALVLQCDPGVVVAQLRTAFGRIGSVEESRVLLDLPCTRARFPDPDTAAAALGGALAAFSYDALRAHAGVARSLTRLSTMAIPVVGHTEATATHAVQRLRQLELHGSLAALFAGCAPRRPRSATSREGSASEALSDVGTPAPPFPVRQLGPALAKPEPATVVAICTRMGVLPSEVLYVGDNLVRDIAMARRAGAWAAWARYGTEHDDGDWERLRAVTHWPQAAIDAAEHPDPTGEHAPHATLVASFAEIFEHFSFEAAPTADAESA